MKRILFIMIIFAYSIACAIGQPRVTISLNGEWSFDQTLTAFPPAKYTRKIPVPGLIHLATPKVDEYDRFFKRPDTVVQQEGFNFLNSDYTPKYNWYRKIVDIPANLKGREAFIKVTKSQYVTQIYVNGIDVGWSMECFTPIEFPITRALKFGQENEIVIKVGDRAWLPSQAPGNVDKEKVYYLPGIWDDVEISFTGRQRINKALMLPSVAEGKVTAKLLVRSMYPAQMNFGDPMYDSCRVKVEIFEKVSGRKVAENSFTSLVRRDNNTELSTEIPMTNINKWTPDNPFLYKAVVTLYDDNQISDTKDFTFGMRDFGKKGKHFTLNGDIFYLRGGNITLQRFFEDPDCGALVWDRAWVKKLLSDLPHQVHWNAMRICVGVVPDFWYDIADENGILLQNEWFFWQNHGWNDETRTEFYNWVWSDGNHPSIAIWDAINENSDDYIGNSLIPELKKLDPTRIWDTGYMTSDEMINDEMDEPHPYRAITIMPPQKVNDYFAKNPYNLGNLDDWHGFTQYLYASSPQLVNEYGWIWLWRNGQPSKLALNNYNYFLGENATPDQRRELQAYWLQLETEWLRAERSFAGVLAFCYLTNNYGFTGDWFMDNVADLKPSPAFNWFKHAFAPEAVFINLTDMRYTKHLTPFKPGDNIAFNLVGVNDNSYPVKGIVTLKLYNSNGQVVFTDNLPVSIDEYFKVNIPYVLKLPMEKGGYLIVAEFVKSGSKTPVISRRYIKVGDNDTKYEFYDIKP